MTQMFSSVQASEDFLKWISTPDDDLLPPLKFIYNDAVEFKEQKSKSFRSNNKNVKSIQVALVTDSMNVTSSIDSHTLEVKESFDFDQHHSANFSDHQLEISASLFAGHDFLATEPSTSLESTSAKVSSTTKRQCMRSKLSSYSATRKCVSCPEATRVERSDSSIICSEASYGRMNRVTRSMEETSLRKYRELEVMPQHLQSADTTTLESMDFGVNDQFADNTILSSTEASYLDCSDYFTHTESSIEFSSDEGSVEYDDNCSRVSYVSEYDDNCSRVSYVSVYRASPVENLTTDATAASLEIMTGSVRLTYVNPHCVPPVRPPQLSTGTKYCKTCTLDGLKYHPACPAASVSKHGSSLQGSKAFGGEVTEELCIIANRRF